VLTAMILAPVVAALAVALVPSNRKELHLPLGVALSIMPLALAGYLFWAFQPEAGFQFAVDASWYEPWGMSWSLGVDGISMPMVVLTALLVPIALAASGSIAVRTKEFIVYTLLLEAGMFGAFMARDLYLFFVFFEVILVPMYFIIGIWGGERRIYASVKFFIYTAFGSALMLAAIIGLASMHTAQFGSTSFALADLMNVTFSGSTVRWLFAAVALAFAI
jgi:NADH-quinone oxidoreductase subunit M